MRLVLVIAVVLLSCADDNAVVQLGRLDIQGLTHITVPGSVRAAENFDIEIQTYGTSCYAAASTDVALTTQGATVTVYDRVPLGRCTADLSPIEHHTTLSFSAVGAKVITVHGADAGGGPADYSVNVDVQ
jgi:hypothetical protein